MVVVLLVVNIWPTWCSVYHIMNFGGNTQLAGRLTGCWTSEFIGRSVSAATLCWLDCSTVGSGSSVIIPPHISEVVDGGPAAALTSLAGNCDNNSVDPAQDQPNSRNPGAHDCLNVAWANESACLFSLPFVSPWYACGGLATAVVPTKSTVCSFTEVGGATTLGHSGVGHVVAQCQWLLGTHLCLLVHRPEQEVENRHPKRATWRFRKNCPKWQSYNSSPEFQFIRTMYSFSQSFQLADDVTVQTGILAIRHDSTADKNLCKHAVNGD